MAGRGKDSVAGHPLGKKRAIISTVHVWQYQLPVLNITETSQGGPACYFLSFFQTSYFFLIFIYLTEPDLSCSMITLNWGRWDLVPCPGIKPVLPALGAWSLSHWTTREVPCLLLFTKPSTGLCPWRQWCQSQGLYLKVDSAKPRVWLFFSCSVMSDLFQPHGL